MTPLKIICAFVFVLLVCWLFRLFFFAPVVEVTAPLELMTAEEEEAADNKQRLQREMHQRGRDMKKNLGARLK